MPRKGVSMERWCDLKKVEEAARFVQGEAPETQMTRRSKNVLGKSDKSKDEFTVENFSGDTRQDNFYPVYEVEVR